MLHSYEKEAAKAILNSPIATLHKTKIEHPRWYHFFTAAAALTWADSYDSEKYRIAKNAHPIISKIPPTVYRLAAAIYTLLSLVCPLCFLFAKGSILLKSVSYVLMILLLLPVILLYLEAPDNTTEMKLIKCAINSLIILIALPTLSLGFFIIFVLLFTKQTIPLSVLLYLLFVLALTYSLTKAITIRKYPVSTIINRNVVNISDLLSFLIFFLTILGINIYVSNSTDSALAVGIHTVTGLILGPLLTYTLSRYNKIRNSITQFTTQITRIQIGLQTSLCLNYYSLIEDALTLDKLLSTDIFYIELSKDGLLPLQIRINILLYFDSIAHAQQMNQIHYRETANNNSNLNIHCKILEDYITLLIARYAKNDKYQKLLTKQTQRAYIQLQSVPVEQLIKDLNSFLYNIAKYLQ